MHVTSVLPESISPVNASEIQMGISFPYFGVMEPEYFTVQMFNIYDPSTVLDLSVTGVDAVAGNLKLRYMGGAVSGYYQFSVQAKDVGRISAEGVLLLVVSTITEISPRKGSSLGGTLLTIKG